MAIVKYIQEIQNMVGTLKKSSGIIFRQKIYKECKRSVEGKHEVYKREKRDYKRTPLRAGEAEAVNRFREASKQMRKILADKESEAYQEWRARFEHQLKNPEKGMKVDEKGHAQPYVRMDTYVRAKLMAEMKGGRE